MKRKLCTRGGLFFLSCFIFLLHFCGSDSKTVLQVEGKYIRIDFNENLYSRVVSTLDGSIEITADFYPSEYVSIVGNNVTDFTYLDHSQENFEDIVGMGKKYTIIGESNAIRKKVQVCVYEDFPMMAVYQVSYTNTGNTDLRIDSWTNNHYRIESRSSEEPKFWSYQSGSYENRPDWVLPLEVGFEQENHLGMNATDYGGGTPVVDVWTRNIGLGVGHLEMVPKLVSLPVKMPSEKMANLSVEYKIKQLLKPGDSLSTLKSFVIVHRGDYFKTLVNFRRFMVKQGIKLAEYPESAYEPVWCAWGYERNFSMDQIYNTLPKVKDLGYKWAVLDDGWQTAEGDWFLLKSKFPNGDKDMQKLTSTIRKAGLRPKIWWTPLAADPNTDLLKQHEEYLLLNEDGSKQEISWWDAYYLCPAYPPVQEYTRKLVVKFMENWGYDGLKIDGQHLNGVPPCYNPAHKHGYPAESVEKLPEFFKMIYKTALNITSDAVIEICPCGTAYAFHTMPYMNQSVSSDPESSWQIRLKGKTLKALMGESMPYYGDHVELSDGRDDFASTVGIGGVVGTKFTWPVGAKKDSKIDLTTDKERHWKLWIDIYLDKMLSKGIYMGELYDIGFDHPETHAIKINNAMYYAYYANSYKGEVELRGLAEKKYRVLDYLNEKNYGSIKGPLGKLSVDFEDHLLLEVIPE